MKTMLEEVHQVRSWGFYELHTAPPGASLLVEPCCPKDAQALVYSQFFSVFFPKSFQVCFTSLA